VQDTLWGRAPIGGRNYLLQFFAWSLAWTPGLVALTWGASPRRRGALPAPPGSERLPPDAANDSPADLEVDVTISGPDLLARIDRGEVLPILDVRSEGEFSAGHVPGAVNVPFTQVLSRMSDIPGAPDDELFVYCGHGPRAYMAAVALRRGGRVRIVYVSGHWAAWRAAGLRVEQ
jgi:rhodanese-related sulfurtransferase